GDLGHFSDHQGSANRFAHRVDGNVDRHLLAAFDLEQVDMLDESAKHLALHLLRDSQMALAADFHRQQSIRVLQGEHERMAGQGDMDRFLAQLIQHAGYLLIAPQSAGRALPEFGARFGVDLNFGHGKSSSFNGMRYTRTSIRSVRKRCAIAGCRALNTALTSGAPCRLRCCRSSIGPGIAHAVAWQHPRRGNLISLTGGVHQYLNRLVTEPSINTALTAWASSGAIDSTVSLSKRFCSGIGSVLVTITSHTEEFFSRSTAGPLKTAWVAAITTSAAPSAFSASAACTIVPPVSIMSSTRMQTRPSTSPTTRLARDSFGRVISRVLWMNASGTPPSEFAHDSATLMRPASGETTVSGRSP